MNTGQFIQKVISDRKLTKVSAVKLLGIARPTLDDYIKGKTTPTVN